MRLEKKSGGTTASAEDQQLRPVTRSRRTAGQIADGAGRSTRRTVKRTLLTLKRWYVEFHRKVGCRNECDVECRCQNEINENKLAGTTSALTSEDVKDAWDFANENMENELRELAAKRLIAFG